MSNYSDKIYSWIPSTGEKIPLRYKGWWVQYPKPSCSNIIYEPFAHQCPNFQAGDLVRLKGKPDKIRKVLKTEWHRHRYEFVYIVETSAPEILVNSGSPYWFEAQLLLEKQVDD